MIKTGQTIQASDFIITLTAGEALSANDAVYLKASDGKAYKCDADDIAMTDFLGFAQEAATLNGSVNVIHFGPVGGFVGLTAGSDYYLSGTAGAITATAPARAIRVGKAVTTTILKIEPKSNTYTFTASGTFSKPAWASFVLIELWGAGGSGGSVISNSGAAAGGGGGGEYRSMLIPASMLATSETVTVGTGGAARVVASVTSQAGQAGGNTSFGTWQVANGGAGGSVISADAQTASGGAGGTGGTAGSILVIKNESGAAGGQGSTSSNGSGTAGSNATYAGAGGGGAFSDASSGLHNGLAGGVSTYAGDGGVGSSAYGSGGAGQTLVSGSGTNYGGGGGGSAQGATTSGSCTSGAGANGLVRVTVI